MTLSVDDRQRLARLLAMFSSTFDGEIVNAARAAERLVKARGETWETIVAVVPVRPTARGAEPPRPKPKPHRSDFQDEIDACQLKAKFLTPWEREFLTSISDRWTLSEKQRGILDRIKEKLLRHQDLDF